MYEEHKKWAEELLNASKLNFENGYYNVAVALAVESLYIHLLLCLLNHDVVIPWYLDFESMFRILEKFNDKIKEIRDTRRDFIFTLNDLRIKFRYSSPINLSKEEAKEIISFVEEVITMLNL